MRKLEHHNGPVIPSLEIGFSLMCFFLLANSALATSRQYLISSRPICLEKSATCQMLDVCRLDSLRFIAAYAHDSTGYIQLFHFSGDNLQFIDSIALSHPFTTGSQQILKFVNRGDGKLYLYWLEEDLERNQSDNYVLSSCEIGNNPYKPEELGRLNYWDVTLFPNVYYDQNKGITYLIHKHSGEKHFYLRIDNLEVKYSKDYYHVIGDSSLSEMRRIQPKGTYQIFSSIFLLRENRYYSVYDANYENKPYFTYIYLDEYSDWNPESHNAIAIKKEYEDTSYYIRPIASINTKSQGAIFWQEYNGDKQALNYVRIKDDNDEVKIISVERIKNSIDAVMNENGEILVLTEHKYFVINSSDSLVFEKDLPYIDIGPARLVNYGKDESSLYGIVIHSDDNSNEWLELIKIQ